MGFNLKVEMPVNATATIILRAKRRINGFKQETNWWGSQTITYTFTIN
jgi:hypothetical protein